MKSKFKFKKVSPDWHYNKFEEPSNELEKVDRLYIHDDTLQTVNNIISSPYSEGGIKRVHIGNPVEDVNSSIINERVAHMREVGYDEDKYFIEFINDKFSELEKQLSEKYNISPLLIANKEDIKQIALGEKNVKALKGWRYEIFGSSALKLIEGSLNITVKEGTVIIE